MSDSVFKTDGNGTITGLVDTAYAGELIIPEYVAGERITAIGAYAFRSFFSSMKLSAVILPNSVISIGEGAFDSQRQLLSINIPNSVVTIGSNAFAYCYKLTTVYIDDPNNLSPAVSSYDWSSIGSSGVTFVSVDELYRTSRLVINKLTLDQYKTAKSEGLADDEVYVVTDLDEVIEKALAGGVKIETGSYTGTGTYGSNNKNTIALPSEPKFGIIYCANGTNGKHIPLWSIYIKGGGGFSAMGVATLATMGNGSQSDNSAHYSGNPVTFSDGVLSWYSSTSAVLQMNSSGEAYQYAFLL